MRQGKHFKSNIIIILSMILGLVCFALAGLFFRAAFGQEDRSEDPNTIIQISRFKKENFGSGYDPFIAAMQNA